MASGDYAVDAVAVAWVFDLPQPTGAVAHAVDAVAADWVFDLPEPTVTFTPRVTVGYAVDAGAVAWVFDLPEPTVTYTPRVMVDHAVDAGAVAWVFDLPQPRRTVTTPTVAVVTLEIDWGNDGTFSHVAADVTGDLVKYSLRTTRGRTLQSRRKATAGRLECKLWNRESRYDLINSSSPIYEQDFTGVRVRVKMDGVTVWGGILDRPRYRNRPVPQVDIIALGRLSTLRQPVSVVGQTSSSIGTIAKLVGDALGLVTTYLTGGKILDRWKGVNDQDALGVLHDLEETEEGFLFERAGGDLELEAEDARSSGTSAVSALTLKDEVEAATDVLLLRGSGLDWGFRQIANKVLVGVETLEVGGEQTLWTSSQALTLDGTSSVFVIEYPNAESPSNHRGAASWITPVAGTDYTAQTGLTVTGEGVGARYRLTIGNTSGGSITIPSGGLKVRGTPISEGLPVFVESKDAGSITAFGPREYARPSRLFTTIGAAQEYADGIISRQKAPHGWLVARWPAYLDVAKARTLDLSRRITVERQGETQDYFIEGVGLAMRGFARMEYLLSPVPGVTKPSAPVVTVTAVSGQTTQLAASWTAPFNGGSAITGYDVRYKRSTHSSWTSWTHTGTGLTTTITGLEQGGVSYGVQVRAKNAQGSSLWSATGSALTASVVPNAPSAPSVNVTLYAASLDVSWAAPDNDGGKIITDYDVQYRAGSSGSFTTWAFSGTGRSTTITGLLGSTSYQVQVRAQNSVGESNWSSSGAQTTIAATVPPAPSLSFAGTMVTWTITTNNGAPVTRVGYRRYITNTQRQSSESALSSNPFTGTILIFSTTVSVEVRLQNSAGWGQWRRIYI